MKKYRVVSRFTGQGFLYCGSDLAAARYAVKADKDGPVSQYRTEIQEFFKPFYGELGWHTIEYYN